jgi:WD40 repeat protein
MFMTWSPDSRLLVIAEAKRVRLWDVTTNQPVREIAGLRDGYNLVAWSPDGKALAVTTTGGDVVLYETTAWEPLHRLACQSHQVLSLAWSPDSRMLAVGCHENKAQTWDAASGKPLLNLKVSNSLQGVYGVGWSPDGKTLFTLDRSVRLWDAASGGFRHQLSPLDTKLAAWSPRNMDRIVGAEPGSRMVPGEPGRGTLHFWRTSSGNLVKSVDGHPRTDPPRDAVPLGIRGLSLAISPAGHYRGSPGIEEEIVYVVQAERGQETLRPEEFARRYDWKNDPEKAAPVKGGRATPLEVR